MANIAAIFNKNLSNKYSRENQNRAISDALRNARKRRTTPTGKLPLQSIHIGHFCVCDISVAYARLCVCVCEREGGGDSREERGERMRNDKWISSIISSKLMLLCGCVSMQLFHFAVAYTAFSPSIAISLSVWHRSLLYLQLFINSVSDLIQLYWSTKSRCDATRHKSNKNNSHNNKSNYTSASRFKLVWHLLGAKSECVGVCLREKILK